MLLGQKGLRFVCVLLHSSQTEANQFTGMVYQGLLLSERKRLRTESIEEHITPNSAPAQWPGNKDSTSRNCHV